TQALDASRAKTPAPPPPPNVQAEYNRHMQAGAALEKQQKFAEAMKAYQEALKLMPQDAKAAAALRTAEFSQHMAGAQKTLTARPPLPGRGPRVRGRPAALARQPRGDGEPQEGPRGPAVTGANPRGTEGAEEEHRGTGGVRVGGGAPNYFIPWAGR